MRNFSERVFECKTDTQYKVMLSGYHWCAGQIKSIADSAILDAACGTGYGSYYLSGKAKKVIGIDASLKVIALCKKKYKRDNLLFRQMDCAELQFEAASFDAVVSQDTIEHIKDDRRFLSGIKRVLKPNGVFIVFTPNSKEHNENPENIYHVREYSKESLKALLSDYFSNIKFYGKRLSKEWAKLEKDLAKVRSYDRLGIRKMIPRHLRHVIGSLIAKAKGDKTLEDVSVEEVEYFEGFGDTSTLIAVCANT